MLTGNAIISLYEKLETIEDARDIRGRKYPLAYIFLFIVIGYLMGKTDFVNMEHVLKLRQDDLRSVIKPFLGIPSHDTFSRIVRITDEKEVRYALLDWIFAIFKGDDHIAIDGKGVRAATDKICKKETPYILNALHTGYQLVMGQFKIEEKTNEITGIPELLRMLDIKDITITIDAIGTQTTIAEQIVEQGGHFVLPVKGNQGNTMDSITLYMEDQINARKKSLENQEYESDYKEKLFVYEDVENNHGRCEHRTYYLSTNIDCIKGTGFKDVRAIGYVIRERSIPKKSKDGMINGFEKSIDKIAYIMDREMSAKELAKYVRDHWKIENSLHWVLDNVFKEDRSTAKKGNAIANISFFKKVAYNIIRLYKMAQPDRSFEYVLDEFNNDINLIKEYVINGIESLY
ncbi:MAG: ISAs1 family transposase [Longicatena sp.]